MTPMLRHLTHYFYQPLSLLVLAGSLFACGSEEPPLTFDGQLPRFITNFCACSSNVQRCEDEVRNDLESARIKLDNQGKQDCAVCLQTQSRVLQKRIDAGCSVASSQTDTNVVVTICGNHNEACAGYP